MQVLSLAAESFMSLNAVELHLPARGVVLVTGQNGAGKSALCELAAFAAWGQTLRGTSPTRQQPGNARVMTPHGYIARSWNAAGKLSVSNDLAACGLTNTKTQDAIDLAIGTFDLWRRTCVFTSDLLGRFTDATDAERKRFLEEMTDPDGALDEASRKCREELTTVSTARAALETELAVCREKTAGLRHVLDALKAQQRTAPVIPDVRQARDAARATAAAASEQITAIQARTSEITRSLGELRAHLSHAEHHAKLLEHEKCTECRQPIPRELADEAKHEAAFCRERADKAEQQAQQELKDLRAQLAAAQQQHTEAVQEASKLHTELQAAHREELAWNDRAAAIKRQKAQLSEAMDTFDDLMARHAALGDQRAVLTLTDKILSTRGVRSHLLEGVLSSLEVEANEWLARLCGSHAPMRIELRPFTEKVKGGVQDVISLKVAWGGGSFESASRGERRRVDVAVMLALAGLRDQEGNATLWFDEVMDALDDDAVEAACAVLESLARSRCVVVITHNQHLAQYLNCTQHYEVAGGNVTARGSA